MEGNWQLLFQELEKPITVSRTAQTFKRTFPLEPGFGVLIQHPDGAEEELLEQHRAAYSGVKLMRGLWEEKGPTSGTYFPVAAPASAGGVLWCSAGHCLVRGRQRGWKCGYGTRVLGSSPLTKPMAHVPVDLGWLTAGHASGELAEFTPSQPVQRLKDGRVMPDFGFMSAWVPEGRVEQLYIPSPKRLQSGDAVCVLGFAQKPESDWARYALRTEAGYAEMVEDSKVRGALPPPSPEEWLLEDSVAQERVNDLLDVICYPSLLVAAPGQVAAASPRIVEHTCSTFPGMSGAPGVDVQHPWQLLFVHTRMDADFRRNNYGYSVHHPLFVKAYEREVLPKLLDTAAELVSLDMWRCLRAYLDAHKAELADPDGLRQVELRCN